MFLEASFWKRRVEGAIRFGGMEEEWYLIRMVSSWGVFLWYSLKWLFGIVQGGLGDPSARSSWKLFSSNKSLDLLDLFFAFLTFVLISQVSGDLEVNRPPPKKHARNFFCFCLGIAIRAFGRKAIFRDLLTRWAQVFTYSEAPRRWRLSFGKNVFLWFEVLGKIFQNMGGSGWSSSKCFYWKFIIRFSTWCHRQHHSMIPTARRAVFYNPKEGGTSGEWSYEDRKIGWSTTCHLKRKSWQVFFFGFLGCIWLFLEVWPTPVLRPWVKPSRFDLCFL